MKVKMKNNTIPTFTIDDNFVFNDPFESPVLEEELFFARILEFIENNLTSNFKTTVLCYLEDYDGNLSEATLEEEGYYKSLNKCLGYYSDLEQYEVCSRITNLIKEYELQ